MPTTANCIYKKSLQSEGWHFGKLCGRTQGVLRFELDRGVPLEPQNPYPSLRVILAEKDTHF